MIFDWNKACILILQEKRYLDRDRWESKEEYKQQIALCSYLRKIFNKSQVFKKWCSVSNTFITMLNEVGIEGKSKRQELKEYFDTIYEKSSRFKIKDINKKLYIYQEELDLINSLKADKQFRKYIYMLLGICKFYYAYYNKCYLDHKLRGYAFETVNRNKKYGNYVQTLINTNKHCGPIIVSSRTRSRNISTLTILRTEGKEVHEFYTPDELISWLDRDIEDWVDVCPVCGKRFERTTKTKRDCCLECWKEKNKEKSKESMQRMRAQRRRYKT